MGIEHLTNRRDELDAEARGLLEAAEAEKRSLTDEESAKVDELTDQIRSISRDIETRARWADERAKSEDALRSVAKPEATADESADEVETRSADAPKVTKAEAPDAYGMFSRRSWFQDKHLAMTGRADADVVADLEATHRHALDEMQKRDLSTADTAGQEFVPPIYAQDMFAKKREQKAVLSKLVMELPLPAIGRSVTIPYQDGAASFAVVTENNALSETDATFADATADILMGSGLQDMSIQLYERGEPKPDRVIFNHFADVAAKYWDQQLINSSTSNHQGVLQASNTQSTTFTSTGDNLVGLYPKIHEIISDITTNAAIAPEFIVVHGRRFSKWASELDSSNRPLLVPMPNGPTNALVVNAGTGQPVDAGHSGYMLGGLPVYIDNNIPTTLGSGTNEDAIILGASSEGAMMLSNPMFETSAESGFATATIRVRMRQYCAFDVTHRAASWGKITGAGLATPTFS